MRVLLLSTVLLLAAGCAHEASSSKKSHGAPGAIVLAGETVPVRWTDGDSFEITGGRLKGKGTRLVGYNTLEAYGPVHRWGAWTGAELYEIATSSKELAATDTWDCVYAGQADSYGRLLIACPDVARKLVAAGHAFVFAVGEAPDESLLAVQREAQQNGVGIWAKGVPPRIITSVHAAKPGKPAYNRVVDVNTGRTEQLPHNIPYTTCEEVCVGEATDRSCLVNVPFERRYRNQPDCLR